MGLFYLSIKKGYLPLSPPPIRVTERPLLKHRNFSVIIGGAGGPMAKGGTKSTQCCGNSVGDASASLRTNDRGFFVSYKKLLYSEKKFVRINGKNERQQFAFVRGILGLTGLKSTGVKGYQPFDAILYFG